MFTYKFIRNIDEYEPKMFLGLTIYEAFGVAASFVVPMMMFQNIFGFTLGAIGLVLSFSLFKRFEKLGNLSGPVYAFKRLKTKIQGDQISLSHLYPAIEAEVTVSDYEGQQLATYGKKGGEDL